MKAFLNAVKRTDKRATNTHQPRINDAPDAHHSRITETLAESPRDGVSKLTWLRSWFIAARYSILLIKMLLIFGSENDAKTSALTGYFWWLTR